MIEFLRLTQAGLRYKVKAAVGLYQCIGAVPSVFNVGIPRGMKEYARWMYLMEFPADLGIDVIIPSDCLGSYRRRLLVGSCWPIALVVVITCCLVIQAVVNDRRKVDPILAARGIRLRSAVRSGLQRALPPTLIVSFVLVPSTSTRIFKTFRCDSFEVDRANSIKMRYLRDDLALDCDSDEYDALRSLAALLLVFWPIGGEGTTKLRTRCAPQTCA